VTDDDLRALAMVPGVEGALQTIHATLRDGGFVRDEPRVPADERARIVASMRAADSTADELHEVMARTGIVAELVALYACWAQELVMRGERLGGPDLDALAVELARRGHPLADLPMQRLPLEERARVIPHRSTVTSWTAWGYPFGDPGSGPVSESGVVPDRTALPDDPRIVAAYEAHLLYSNGRTDQRVVALEPPLHAAADPALLASLDLPCLAGGLAPEVHAIVAADAYTVLFIAATSGGAYGHPPGTAYGRRAVWRALAGLVGAADDATLFEIDTLASAAHWSSFGNASRWFDDVAWDIGIAAVGHEGRRLAVFAGTDTD